MMKSRLFNRLCIFLIMGLRPLFGIAHCKYAVSCTQYAKWQLQEKSLATAFLAIAKRVLSCNPFI